MWKNGQRNLRKNNITTILQKDYKNITFGIDIL